MNLDATAETVRLVAEVLKLAAILDDRVANPDKARVMGWAEQVQRHPGLTRDDLLDGLQSFYDTSSDRPIQVGDLISRSKIAKRDRVDREESQARDERRERFDAKAGEDEARAVAAGVVFGPIKNLTPRLQHAINGLQTCHGRAESLDALTEYFDAKREAAKPRKKAS